MHVRKDTGGQQFRGLEPHLLLERTFLPAASWPRFHPATSLKSKAAHRADRNRIPLETFIER
jgi:hypothetical protein